MDGLVDFPLKTSYIKDVRTPERRASSAELIPVFAISAFNLMPIVLDWSDVFLPDVCFSGTALHYSVVDCL